MAGKPPQAVTYFSSQYAPMPQLNVATLPLAGTELMRVYQDGDERSAPASAITAGSQPLDPTLTAIAALTGTGIIVRTGNGDTDAAVRTITQSTGITVTNGSGVAGNPTISITNSGVTAATYGSATKSAIVTLNAQGQATSASESTITPAVGSITGLGINVATALAVNVGSAGAFVTFNGAGGTPSSLALTNATGLPVAGGGTGAATFTAHGVLLGQGTSAVAATSAGTAGQVLTSGGASADPTYTTAGRPLLDTVVASASATLPFTAMDAAKYAGYEVLLENLVMATDNVSLLFEVSVDGGANWLATGTYNYARGVVQSPSTIVGSGAVGDVAGVIATSLGNTAARSLSGDYKVIAGGAVAAGTKIVGSGTYTDTSGSVITQFTGAHNTTTSQVNAFRVRPSSGNVTSGTMRVWGIPK